MAVSTFLSRCNAGIATQATILMSTMGCVYVFLLWSLVPVAFPKAEQLVFYVSGAIIQLVALPLIMVGQRILNEKNADRHDDISEQVADLKTLLQEGQEEIALLSTVVNNQQRLLANQQEVLTRIGAMEAIVKSNMAPKPAKPSRYPGAAANT